MSEERARIESIVAAIWQRVLDVQSVRPTDNFLDLGGNSLRAGEIVWQLREQLGIDVPIDVVLDKETLADLVDTIAPSNAAQVS